LKLQGQGEKGAWGRGSKRGAKPFKRGQQNWARSEKRWRNKRWPTAIGRKTTSRKSQRIKQKGQSAGPDKRFLASQPHNAKRETPFNRVVKHKQHTRGEKKVTKETNPGSKPQKKQRKKTKTVKGRRIPKSARTQDKKKNSTRAGNDCWATTPPGSKPKLGRPLAAAWRG